ncbi:putative deoxyribonuclease YcfH [Candidatus Phycorickettsia trachydisci]|uniref:Putative deoxyribonuclease YcfH n=1 Tax=Candidatus Phycorickettsia trachydisci TaxID=2115978 RepID=A0A2P1P6W5_9RICK|nr:TatD family hydrolase [Candidatus Phycorickettsia trachydisci]AVP87012.1 putative deoxyribonuclease YcfH [Candidatus Phycorickettsia trachydisci]
MLVDSHCHLNMLPDSLESIKRANAAGVSYMQTICTKLSEIDELLNIVQEDGIFASCGVHPCHIKQDTDIPSVDRLVELSQHKKIIGFGETGLDYYYQQHNKQAQIKSFTNHIEASSMKGLPLIVHTRDADSDMSNILRSEYENSKFSGLIHCFTSDINFAKKVLDIDFYISISGIVTFKNAAAIVEVVKYVPLDRLLIETDSPYLAPVPMRGKQNEPAFVRFVAEKIAELKNISKEKVAEQTTNNFFKLFTKAA